MAARITDIIPFLLITVLCVGVVEGGYQALEYFVLRPSAEKVQTPGPVVAKKDAPVKDQQQVKSGYRIILQRNLFGPLPGNEKGGAKVNVEQTEDLKLTSLNIVLMGTTNGGGSADRAIILDKGSRKQDLYEKGDAIQGAFIKEILRGKVILDYNGKDEMLDMSEAVGVRSTYAAPAAGIGGQNQLPVNVAPRQPRAVVQPNDLPVSPQGTPTRVISRPRIIRPTRSIQ